MKILAAGDIHSDPKLVKHLAEKAEKENVDLVILCGDLTYAEQSTTGIIGPFVKKNKKVVLIPGNHETSDLVKKVCKKTKFAIPLHRAAFKVNNSDQVV